MQKKTVSNLYCKSNERSEWAMQLGGAGGVLWSLQGGSGIASEILKIWAVKIAECLILTPF